MKDSIIEQLLEPKFFDAFIRENMKLSTYKAEWKNEMNTEYEAAKVYQANVAEYAAAMVGSVIDGHAEKPTHQMPTLNQLSGSIAHMADEWQMDNARLEQFYYLEGRYRNKKAGYTNEQNVAEFRKLIQYLFNPFEQAVIAPHKRIDMLYFEGLFNGTQTVNRHNNTAADVSFTYELGVKKFAAITAAWGTKEATPIEDIQALQDYARSKGKIIRKLRMSRSTFRKMCKSSEIMASFTLKLNKIDVKPSVISPTDINTYLESIMLPTIVIEEDKFSRLADGSNVNLIKDDRVVAQCADRVAVLKVSDPLESIDKLPGKTYSTHDDNLVGFYRDKHGRFVDYDMWATPVFVGRDDFFILDTSKTSL